jgi:hypothetical protein
VRRSLDCDSGLGVDVAEDPAFALGDDVLAELLDGDFITPLAECALSELLDVALVDQGDGLAAHFQRALDGVADQALGGEDADGLDADAGVGADFFLAAFEQVFVDELNEAGHVSEPCLNSMPEYTSSVFSRKMTMSTFSGCFTGLGTPW